MNTIKILVCEYDEQDISLLNRCLSAEGWSITTTGCLDDAAIMLKNNSFDLVVLSVIIPDAKMERLCQIVGRKYGIPLIVLGTLKGIKQKVKFLDLGAYDYITKPFSIEEVVSRIKSLFRLVNAHDKSKHSSLFVYGDIVADFKYRTVIIRGSNVSLTPTEYCILEELITNAGIVLTYHHLLHKIWGTDYNDENQYLHVYISHLRKKIEQNPDRPRYIINIPRVGYKFQT
jgi:two-component system, OmpR family, KDP operon response regulator KdpE